MEQQTSKQADATNAEKDDAVVLDLSTMDVVTAANNGAWVTLYHPTSGVKLKTKIRVVGRDSDAFREIQRDQNRERLAKAPKRNALAAMAQASENQEQEALELLARCTMGWADLLVNGKAVPFSVENAMVIYRDYPWIKEQIDLAIADRANFLKD